MAEVFLSHSSADKPMARRVARRLRHRGVDVWLDEVELELGDALPVQLRDRISACPWFVVLASEHARASMWVGLEIEAAISAGRVVVPFFPPGVTPWGQLADHKGVVVDRNSFEQVLDDLAQIVHGSADEVTRRDQSVLANDFSVVGLENPALAAAVDAALTGSWLFGTIQPNDRDVVETLLWIAYERGDPGRAAVALVAARLFRSDGIGYELLAQHLAEPGDRSSVLAAFCDELGEAALVAPAMRLLAIARPTSDMWLRELVTHNLGWFGAGQIEDLVRQVTRPLPQGADPVERFLLADFLYRHRESDERLAFFWFSQAANATADDRHQMRHLIRTFNDAARDGLALYASAENALRSRIKSMVRDRDLQVRLGALELVATAKDERYRSLARLVHELRAAPGSAEWNDPPTPDAFEVAYLRAVDATAMNDEEGNVWNRLADVFRTL